MHRPVPYGHERSAIRDCMAPLAAIFTILGSNGLPGAFSIETSICTNCGFMPGEWLPGLPCPECGELFL